MSQNLTLTPKNPLFPAVPLAGPTENSNILCHDEKSEKMGTDAETWDEGSCQLYFEMNIRIIYIYIIYVDDIIRKMIP